MPGIVEMIGYEKNKLVTAPLFRFQETGGEGDKVLGELVKAGELVHVEKLRQAGIPTA